MPVQTRPPAEQVTDGPYEVRTMTLPPLSGRGLSTFVAAFERINWVLFPSMHKSNGFTQALRNTHYPESPL